MSRFRLEHEILATLMKPKSEGKVVLFGRRGEAEKLAGPLPPHHPLTLVLP